MNKSKEYEFPIKVDQRPKYLSQSSTSSEDVILYLIKKNIIKSKYFMLLQPTSPDRRVYDIKKCIYNALKNNLDTLISLSDRYNAKKYLNDCIIYKNSRFNYSSSEDNLFFNGAIYLARTKYFLKYKTLYSKSIQYAHFMPHKFSKDIDTLDDFLS